MPPTPSDTPDQAAIRHLIENWAAAVRAQDLDQILAFHSPEILMFDLPPPLVARGIEAYRKTWDLFFSWSRDSVFDITELNIIASSEVAFATALMRCAGAEPDQPATTLDFRLTIGLRKLAGQWTIVHEHHSIPAT